MIALYALNLALAAGLLAVPWWFSRRFLKLPGVNPLTITMLVWMPFELMKLLIGPGFLLDEGLWDPGFQYAILMTNVLTLSQTAGLVVFFKLARELRIEYYLPFRRLHLNRRHLARASLVFILIFTASFVLLASAEFGVLAWIINPREGYQLHRVGQGQWYALCLSSLSVATMLALLSRPAPRAILVKALFFLCLAYLMGSKGVMLSYFTAIMVVLWFVGWPHLTKLFLIGAPLVFLALAWNLYLSLSDRFQLLSLVEYFDYYRNGADYYRGILSGDIQLFHGQVFTTSFWSYVPRALVPDKPFVYGAIYVNEIFFPGAAELTNTPAFGGAVEQYADFGVAGVVVFGFFSSQAILNAVVYYLVFRAPGIVMSRISLGSFMALLAMSGPHFGIFIPGALYAVLVIGVALIIAALRSNPTRVAAATPTSPIASV
jgi:hypothetical protein